VKKFIRIGVDLAKNYFQVHALVSDVGPAVTRKLRRSKMHEFFSQIEPSLIGRRRLSSCSGVGGTTISQTRGSPRFQASNVLSSDSPSIPSVFARRRRLDTAMRNGLWEKLFTESNSTRASRVGKGRLAKARVRMNTNLTAREALRKALKLSERCGGSWRAR
jgi:hypothetical protein